LIAPPPVSTLGRLLELRAENDEGDAFLQVGDERRTAQQLIDSSRAVASTLLNGGVRSGDRVAVVAENCIELVELWFGCITVGAILVPINTASKAGQLAHIFRDAEPTVVLSAAEHLAKLVDVDRPKSIRNVWTIGTSSIPDWNGIPIAPFFPGDASFGAAPSQAVDHPAAVLYTSGTTGPSKGVVCPHSQFYWWGVNTANALGITQDDVLYNCLPLFHMNALNTIVQGLISGARVVIGPRFSASRFWRRLIEADANATYLLGAMVSILAAQPATDLDREHSVRVVLGPATPAHVWSTFEERFGVRLVEGHGMTETNFVIGPLEDVQRPGWMGRVMPGYDARVVDEHNREVPADVAGELVVQARDPASFATGYWRRPSATETAWSDGWFHTGDRVVRDVDGYFRFLDRLKDSMRRRGENISAWEVEQALESHPAVAAAAAVPVPSELGEDEVMAFVVPTNGATVDPEALVRHCEPRLAYFAIPRYIEFLDSLPLTENGKVQKYVLRERGVSEATWDRERAGIDVQR
jgi:crotonobetaine/carnitine-CoA ligase